MPATLSGFAKKDSPLPTVSSNIFRAKLPSVPPNQPRLPLQEAQLTEEQAKSTAPAENEKGMPANASSKLPKSTLDDRRNPEPPPAAGNPQPTVASMSGKGLQNKPGTKDTATAEKSAEAKTVLTGNAPTRAKKADKAEAYDLFDDSKLNLQALAWFNDPRKRMAVINSRIVREGESVDGYQVTKIRRQDVVVSDGSKLWRLEFDLKQ